MNIWLTRIVGSVVSVALAAPAGVLAQTPPPAAAPAAAGQSAKSFSQQELDQLLAPIALYPDALLAQVLMAATYPLDVVEAARWVKANPNVKGKALEDAMQGQRWDPSIKSLAAFPQVLAMMNEKLDWTQKLGDAFLGQQPEVMSTVQALRARAAKEGNLKSTSEQVVKTEVVEQKTVYIIEPAKPEVVYVPTYNPTVVYGSWWWPAYPPYYYYPPGYAAGAALFSFGVGVAVGAALWGGCNWGRNEVNVNVNRYNSFNRTNISNTNWNHNVENRRGVAYRDNATAQKYNRGGNQQNVQSREAFRGRAEAGRTDLSRPEVRQQADRAARQPSAATRDSPGMGGATARDRAPGGGRDVAAGGAREGAGAGGRDFGSGGAATRDASGGRSSRAFAGAGGGAQTSDISSRGNASRQSMSSHGAGRGGGGMGGGGGGGRGGGGGGRGR